MAVFTWVVLGLLVASIAKLVAWDDTPIGWAPVILLGAGGAIGGAYLRGVLFASSEMPGFDPGSLVMAIGGAAAALYLYYIAIGRRQIMSARAIHEVHRRAA